MITHICDRCGRPIFQGEAHYVARLEVFAAPDPIEITPQDLLEDTAATIDELLEQCAGLSEEEVRRDVYGERKFDLCRLCQRNLLANPLAV